MKPEPKREGQTQATQPKKGKPIEIPVPKRSAFDKLIDRAIGKGSGPRRPSK